ncbi:MAG TPA: uridine diphosphate-N-acetylglucosamine-binding protein YvcK [Bryobacteraceae bacterium]|nr:uridine diphosphate-N-acetylglucosamine-binding protein YvcK [Bryobacteraceae bacterium]
MTPSENASSTAAVSDGPLHVVSIGGGTGLSVLLQGLKEYVRMPTSGVAARSPVDIAAVVTVTDDGGSSGRLRREFDVLPPGDIRNCLVALSEDETLLSRLFQYRFESGRGLKGHSFGNLFLTALTNITGDFPEAVRESSDVLAIKGRIYPATAANIVLEAVLENGQRVLGETRISRSRRRIETVRLRPRRCRPLSDTLAAIAQADVITLGPGSLFTSVIPNLLVEGIPEAIRKSPAIKAYFVNLMWQPGETTNFRASDHIAAIHRHAGGKLLDYAVVNTRQIRPALLRRYAREHSAPVENDFAGLTAMDIHVVCGDLLQQSDVVRHNPEAIAAIALELAIEGRKRRQMSR